MTDRLSPQREAEIAERATKRTAEFTGWLNRYSPMPGQEIANRAEAVLEEDVPVLLAELAAVRAERARLRLALESAKRGRRDLRAENSGMQMNFLIYRSGAAHSIEALRDTLDEVSAERDEAKTALRDAADQVAERDGEIGRLSAEVHQFRTALQGAARKAQREARS